MKHLKHLFTALLLLCCVGTATAHHFDVGGIYYNITDDTNKTVEVTYRGTSYNEYSNEYTGSVVIPESVTYNGATYSVTSIGEDAFRYCSGLTSVTIPNSVTSIGEDAFRYCSGLTSITIPNSVTSIGEYAFYNCTGLEKVCINDLTAWCNISFGSSSANPFYYAKNLYLNDELITELTIPNSVTSIGEYAFFNCTGLTSITIPNSVTSIEYGAFCGCSGLTSVTIPNSVTSIENSAFYNCSGLTSITIPNSVTSIENSAFYNCTGLKDVHIGDLAAWCNISFGSLDANPLYYAKNLYLNDELITELTIPNSVTSIGEYAFFNCTGLTSVTIPNSVTSIGEDAFRYCSGLTSITIPNSVTSIGEYAFYNCTGLKTVYNFSNLTFSKGSSKNGYVAYYAGKVYNAPNGFIDGDFIWCENEGGMVLAGYLGNATELAMPTDYNGKSVTSIGNAAFRDCSELTSVEIPNSVTSIGNQAFYNCSELNEVHISDLTAWCNIAFASSDANPLYYAKNLYLNDELITELTIPNSVTSIGEYAFFNCTGLTSITIPNSVTSIEYGAFYNCSGLKTIYNFSNLTFSKGSSNNGYVAYYATKVINAPNAVIEGDFIWCKLNGENTLACYLGEVAEFTLPADYNGENYVIGNDAFNGCTGLASIVIPSCVTSIGKQAFENCTRLKTVINFSNLTFSKGSSNNGYVAYYAGKVYNAPNGFIDGDFIWCENEGGMVLAGYLGNATELAMPTDYNGKSVTSIGNAAFSGCTGLTSIEVPNSVTSIGNQAFYNCSELNEVHISDLSAWCNISFGSSNANPLYYAKNLYLNNELITELTIPNSVRNIRNYAFYNCSGLTSIEIPNSVTSIGSSAFYNCSGLKTIYNFSNLTFSKGSSNNGYVAYYATKVINAPNAVIDGDFIWCNLNGANTLACYLGDVAELTLPADYNGENYVIGNDAFNGCTGLASIVIPSSVTSIGNQAFENCTGLKTVINFSNLTFSKGSGNNGYVAYYATKVINAPNAVIDGDFIWCNLNGANTLACYLGEVPKLTLPADYNGENYVIGNDAFNGCTGLASVVIPSSVTNIGEDAFMGCTGLKTVYNFSNLTFGKGENTNGYVAYYADKVYNAPNGSMEGDFIFGKPNNVNTLLYYLGSTANLILPTDYKGENYVIDSAVFKDNTVITSVTIPNSVTSVGDDAFTGCTNVEKLSLDCAEVGDWFSGVSAMKEVTIGNGVTSVVASAFNGCTGLEKVCINDLDAWCGIDFGSADANPLYYAGNLYLNGKLLTDISIPTEVEKVKDYAFYNCNGVTNIDIVDGVKSIGNSAFYGCSDLETLYISNTIESIGDYAFAECNNILDIKIGSKKAITVSENIFSSDAYNNACLYVPTGRKDFYAKTSPWSNFVIREMDFTGIDDMEAEGERVKDVYYDLSGRVVENPSSGIYIINGKKVVIK